MPDYDFNNEMTSWACGKNVEYEMCWGESDEGCDENKGNRGAGAAKNPDTGNNNSLTTLYMRYYDASK